MPYVDQGEAKPMSLPPIFAIVAMVVAAALSPLLWLACFKWFGMSYPGGALAGLAIGLAVKFTLNQPFPPLRIAGIVLTVLASVVGYVWVFYAYSTHFDLGNSITAFFKDFSALLMTGFGAYLAFVLATPRMAGASSGG